MASHPQRLFSALVAAYKECDFGQEERSALEWLERLPPPEMAFSDYCERESHPVFVPVNDVSTPNKIPKAIAAGLKVLPERRIRQERFFPTIIPQESLVHFIWPSASDHDLAVYGPALERLASEVTYLGHSSSLVRVALIEDPPKPSLQPVLSSEEAAEHSLRTVCEGRLSLLEQTYQQSRETLRRVEAPDVPRTGYKKRLSATLVEICPSIEQETGIQPAKINVSPLSSKDWVWSL